MSELRRRLIANAMQKEEDWIGPILPPEYQEVEYIDVNKGAYFNTGVTVTYSHGLLIRESLNSIHDENNLIGIGDTYSNGYFGVLYSKTQNTVVAGWGTSVWSKDLKPFSAGVIYDCKLNYKDDGYFSVDNFKIKYIGGARITLLPLVIGEFKLGDDQNVIKPDGKIYYVEITEGSKVVRSYVPCRNIITGEVGMYEKFEGKFFKSDIDIQFIPGEDVYYEKEIQSSNFVFGDVVVPEEYQQVEYITSTGRQQITLNVTGPLTDLNIDMDFAYRKNVANSMILGSNDIDFFMIGQDLDDLNKYKFQCAGSGKELVCSELTLNTFRNFKMSQKNKKITIDDVDYAYSDMLSEININTINLFTGRTTKSFTSLKRARIYDETEGFDFDLVPCYRISDNMPGLYDINNNTFYFCEKDLFICGKDVYQKQEFDGILPDMFEEVEYLKSTKGQYINTNYYPNINTKIEANILFNRTDQTETTLTNCFLYGGRVSDSSMDYGFSLGTNDNTYRFHYGYSYKEITFDSDGQPFTITQDCTKCYINDELKTTITSKFFESPHLMYLFASNTANTIQTANVTIYSFKIYDNNVLKHNYIPCRRKLDHKPGMFDLVKGVFLGSETSDDFVCGDVVNVTPTEDFEIELPSMYQEVEYIENTGTQYTLINKLLGKGTYEYKVSYLSTTGTSGSYIHLLGANFGYRFYVGYYLNKKAGFGYVNNITGTKDIDTNTIVNGKLVLEDGSQKMYIDDELYASSSVSNNVKTYTSCLFSYASASSTRQYDDGCGKMRLYSLTYTDENGIIKLRLIPCKRKFDNKPGIYDAVSNIFYVNLGTGEFTCGSNVEHTENAYKLENYSYDYYPQIVNDLLDTELPVGFRKVDYVEGHGEEWLDFGYSPKCWGNYQGTTMTIDYQFTSLTRTDGVANCQTGCGEINDSNRFLFNITDGYFGVGLGSSTKTSVKSDLDRHLISLSSLSSSVLLDNISYGMGSYFSKTDYSINIFRRNCLVNGDLLSCTYLHSAKCYGVRINEYNKIQLNLVPCVREIDNEVGLFDTVCGIFYTNQGGGKLTCGITKYDIREDYTTMDNLSSWKLQYINTNYYPNCDTKLDIALSSWEYNSSWQGIFGSRGNGSSYSPTFALYKNTSHYFRTDYNDDNNSIVIGKSYSINTIYRIVKDKNVTYKYDSLTAKSPSVTYSHTYSSFTNSYPAYIFTVNSKGKPNEYPGIEKIYYTKLYDSDVIVRDFIPCIRTLDRKPGMFDRISKKFFVNVGTSEFGYDDEIQYSYRDKFYAANEFTKDLTLKHTIDSTCFSETEEKKILTDSVSSTTWTGYGSVSVSDGLININKDTDYFICDNKSDYYVGTTYKFIIDAWVKFETPSVKQESNFVVDWGSVTNTTYGFSPFGICFRENNNTYFIDNYKRHGNNTNERFGLTGIQPKLMHIEIDDEGYRHYVVEYGCCKYNGRYYQYVKNNGRIFFSFFGSGNIENINYIRNDILIGRGVVAGYGTQSKIKSINIYNK